MIIGESNVSMQASRNFTKGGRSGSAISESKSFASYISGAENTEKPNCTDQLELEKMQDELAGKLANLLGSFSSPADSSTFRVCSYEESEQTSFSAKGMAKTADGRTIDFSIDLFMSRRYVEYTDIKLKPLQNALMDPLVINVGGGITNISDQKFLFDLDMDGKEEEISKLGAGSGFLALDLNEDGIINDGRELFGAKTGDGFGELSEYDSDGNGWIDEADEVFSRLKVWTFDENGNSRVVDLKEAGVGAIFLGSQSTEFSEYGVGGLNGVIRSTGFFLKENGGIGTVQHVDLSYSKEDKLNAYDKSMIYENVPEGTFGSDNATFPTLSVSLPSEENEKDKKDIVKETKSSKKSEEIRKEANARRKKRLMQKKEDALRLQRKRLEKKQLQEKQLQEKHDKKLAEKRREHAESIEEAVFPFN